MSEQLFRHFMLFVKFADVRPGVVCRIVTSVYSNAKIQSDKICATKILTLREKYIQTNTSEGVCNVGGH